MQRKYLARTFSSPTEREANRGLYPPGHRGPAATATSETEYNIIRFWKETKGSCFSLAKHH